MLQTKRNREKFYLKQKSLTGESNGLKQRFEKVKALRQALPALTTPMSRAGIAGWPMTRIPACCATTQTATLPCTSDR